MGEGTDSGTWKKGEGGRGRSLGKAEGGQVWNHDIRGWQEWKLGSFKE